MVAARAPGAQFGELCRRALVTGDGLSPAATQACSARSSASRSARRPPSSADRAFVASRLALSLLELHRHRLPTGVPERARRRAMPRPGRSSPRGPRPRRAPGPLRRPERRRPARRGQDLGACRRRRPLDPGSAAARCRLGGGQATQTVGGRAEVLGGVDDPVALVAVSDVPRCRPAVPGRSVDLLGQLIQPGPRPVSRIARTDSVSGSGRPMTKRCTCRSRAGRAAARLLAPELVDPTPVTDHQPPTAALLQLRRSRRTASGDARRRVQLRRADRSPGELRARPRPRPAARGGARVSLDRQSAGLGGLHRATEVLGKSPPARDTSGRRRRQLTRRSEVVESPPQRVQIGPAARRRGPPQPSDGRDQLRPAVPRSRRPMPLVPRPLSADVTRPPRAGRGATSRVARQKAVQVATDLIGRSGQDRPRRQGIGARRSRTKLVGRDLAGATGGVGGSGPRWSSMERISTTGRPSLGPGPAGGTRSHGLGLRSRRRRFPLRAGWRDRSDRRPQRPQRRVEGRSTAPRNPSKGRGCAGRRSPMQLDLTIGVDRRPRHHRCQDPGELPGRPQALSSTIPGAGAARPIGRRGGGQDVGVSWSIPLSAGPDLDGEVPAPEADPVRGRSPAPTGARTLGVTRPRCA